MASDQRATGRGRGRARAAQPAQPAQAGDGGPTALAPRPRRAPSRRRVVDPPDVVPGDRPPPRGAAEDHGDRGELVWGAVRVPETVDEPVYCRPLDDDLTDLLGIPDPAHVRLPLGPVPTAPDAVGDWMERYRAQLELTRAGIELRRALAETAGYGELKRLERRTKAIEADAAVRQAAGELADPSQSLVYTFFAEVDENSVREAVRELSAWSRRAPGRPIRIVLNSPGGSVLDGLALFDFLGELRSRGHHLQMLALGTAASMGGVLLQAGSERLLGRNAFVLVHEVRGGAIGSSSSLGDTVEFIGRLEERLLTILAERSALSADEIRERWVRRDWWLTAQEAVVLGFADAVV